MKPKIILRKSKTFLILIWAALRYPFFKRRCRIPRIMSIDETLDMVIEKKLSVARFGDSEYLYMSGGKDGLQTSSQKLQAKLQEVMHNTNPRLLVCMVNYHDLRNRTLEARLSAMKFHVHTFNSYKQYINFKYYYGNSNMTRFYITYRDKKRCAERFEKCKKIWEGREIILFEGEQTRFGYGNDLFANTLSVKRVLCPSRMAFDYYDEIVAKSLEMPKQALLIFALGTTATAIAGDLTAAGYQCIDIGNLDVEYEWFRLGVTRKVALNAKQVSEVDGGMKVERITDSEYMSQIIAKIGVK